MQQTILKVILCFSVQITVCDEQINIVSGFKCQAVDYKRQRCLNKSHITKCEDQDSFRNWWGQHYMRLSLNERENSTSVDSVPLHGCKTKPLWNGDARKFSGCDHPYLQNIVLVWREHGTSNDNVHHRRFLRVNRQTSSGWINRSISPSVPWALIAFASHRLSYCAFY